MYCRIHTAAIVLGVLALPRLISPDSLFTGTWCVGREGLVIRFVGKDSLHVTSLADESIGGIGSYEYKDSTLTATLTNDELELKMGYRYKARKDSSIRAKILFFTVDGDSVNHPRRWLRMKRCDPEKGIIPDYEDDEEEEYEENDREGK